MSPNFLISLNKALSAEGNISNNPNDKGGFTYKGISRTKHPAWTGWKIIDSILTSFSAIKTASKSIRDNFDREDVLNNNASLQNEVIQFYRTEYWNKIQGDLLPTQNIANELLESSINLGVTAASEILQRTINLLNRNAALYPDIIVDGKIGNQTLFALPKCIQANGEKLTNNLLNLYQAKRYIEIMERDNSQETFIGWFNRIEINI